MDITLITILNQIRFLLATFDLITDFSSKTIIEYVLYFIFNLILLKKLDKNNK